MSFSPHYYPHISITLHPIIALPFGTQTWQWRIQVFIHHFPIEVPVISGDFPANHVRLPGEFFHLSLPTSSYF